ncbi:hypothetical protein TrVE_jg4986 [Triparma verrucosa]|uniref:WD40 repeat-like protein n=1 Tax=Triparma verrucosa TaxID=1606542 RepID=A0A9W7CL52_9STRA|nr:hypothetical protein TrVE_jg4986 [Triparma verrucosa]
MSSITLIASSELPDPLQPQPGPLWSVALHPSNTELCCVGSSPITGHQVNLYSFPSLDPLPLPPLDISKRTLRCCLYSPLSSLTSTLLVVGSFSGSIYLLQSSPSSPPSLLQTLEGQESEIKSLSYTPTADILASSSRDKTVWLWDTETYEPLSILTGHTGDVKCCKFLSNTKIFSAGYDGLFKVWEEDEDGDWSMVQSLEVVTGNEGDGQETLWCVEGVGSGWRVFLGTGGGETVALKEEGGKYEVCGRIEGKGEECYSVCLPSVRAGHGGVLRSEGRGFGVYRERSGFGVEGGGVMFRKDAGVEEAHSAEVNCVKWCREGEKIVSVGDDGRVRVWKYDIG